MGKQVVAAAWMVLISSFAAGYAQEVSLSIPLEHHQKPQAPMLFLLSDQTPEANDIPEQWHKNEKPPLNALRIGGEIAAGVAVGFGFGLAGYYIAMADVDKDRDTYGIAEAGAFVLGYGAGSIGAAIGVEIVGSIGNETGSAMASLGGSCLGCITVIAVLVLLDDFMGIYGALAFPPICATIAFNLTRRYDSPSAEPGIALINISDGQIRPAIPRVHFRYDSFGRGSLSKSVNLVRVRF